MELIELRIRTLALPTLALLMSGALLHAQEVPDTGGRVFGLVGGVFGDGDSTGVISVGAGLRITRQVGPRASSRSGR